MAKLKEIIKKVLPQSTIECIRNKKNKALIETKQNEIMNKRKNKPLIFLLATPNHGNVGDQAIAIAEKIFLEKECYEYEIVEITFNEYLIVKESLSTLIKSEDILCYHGGGNMGIQYFECESVFRDIIRRFPNNRIIGFPQTIFYGDSEEGINEFERSKKIYNGHGNLTLTARETTTYEIMKKAYSNCKVILTPDIVLYYKDSKSDIRSGALTCLRSDVEKTLTDESHEYIYSMLNDKFKNVKKSDTVIYEPELITPDIRDQILENKLTEFRNAEIVITDRLHGMVFSYLTKTPCIVFSNYNYKVSGVYNWIKENDFIQFADNLNDFENVMEFVLSAKKENHFDITMFTVLRDCIKGVDAND